MPRAARALVASCVALGFACGGSRPARSPRPAGATKTYSPLGIKQDAKAPHQAVILGTDVNNGSTVVPLPAQPTRVVVEAMTVSLGTTIAGGFTPVKLSAAPNPDGSVQVGIYEEMSGGTGTQWRAGVWVAAYVAASTLGKDLTDYTFSASSSGFIDGASASGLIAGGFLAAMTGAPIDPTVTMTGTINPDGTIGPVGGIPEKVTAAIDHGKKRIGFPIGMRWSTSEATGQRVDIVALAKRRGVVAVELASVHDVYRLLTGKELPVPVPLAEAEMALDPQTVTLLETKYRGWQQRLAGEWSGLLQLQQAGRLPDALVVLARQAEAHAARAERFHKQGMLPAAYTKMLAAWMSAATATDTYDVLARVQAGDIRGAIAAIGALDELEQRTVDLFDRIGAAPPTTISGHLTMIAAFQAALRAWGFKVVANEIVERTKALLARLSGLQASERRSRAIADQVVGSVAPTIVLIGRTVAETALAGELLELGGQTSSGYRCSAQIVKQLSTSFQSASVAGIHYFDTLLVEPFAKSNQVSLDEARMKFAISDPNYLVAYMMSHLQNAPGLPQQLKARWGERSLSWALLSLAGNELAFNHAAELVALHYSLGARTNPIGDVVAIEHDKAFRNMLATAERTARSAARAARIATGTIPVQATLSYQLARAQQDGDLSDQVSALASYWVSSAASQTAVMLARN
ncbi:MAG: S16 family serine protease [Kofleriaceae bacterium]